MDVCLQWEETGSFFDDWPYHVSERNTMLYLPRQESTR